MTPEQNRNAEIMKQSLYDMQQRLEKIHEGGGKKAIEKQRERNKLTARERIAYLLDEDKTFLRILLTPATELWLIGETNRRFSFIFT